MAEQNSMDLKEKLEWAGRRFKEVDDALADYVERKPFVTLIEHQQDADAFRVSAHLREQIPWEIAHMVGDVLASLRSTLDYLAWRLCLLEDKMPNQNTYFPIITRLNRDGTAPVVNIQGGSGNRRENLIADPAVLNVLRSVQPFNLGENADLHTLAVLNRLNNAAKHRAPPILVSALRDGLYFYSASRLGSGDIAMVTGSFEPILDGDQLAWIPKSWVGDDPLPVYDAFKVVVSSAEVSVLPRTGKPLWITHLLLDIYNYINNQIFVPLGLSPNLI